MTKIPTFIRPDCRNGVVVMTAHDLPKRVVRWTFNTKAMFVNAVEAGAISVEDMQTRYGVSAEELKSWRLRHRIAGPAALRQLATRRVRECLAQ